MIAQYDILSAVSTDDLVKKVNAKIKEGWQPIGGICCVLVKGNPVFIQSMTKDGR